MFSSYRLYCCAFSRSTAARFSVSSSMPLVAASMLSVRRWPSEGVYPLGDSTIGGSFTAFADPHPHGRDLPMNITQAPTDPPHPPRGICYEDRIANHHPRTTGA